MRGSLICFFVVAKTGGDVENTGNMRRRIFVWGMMWLAFVRPALATTQLIVNGGFSASSYAPWQAGGSLGVQFEPG